jgi:hypothetical protein
LLRSVLAFEEKGIVASQRTDYLGRAPERNAKCMTGFAQKKEYPSSRTGLASLIQNFVEAQDWISFADPGNFVGASSLAPSRS